MKSGSSGGIPTYRPEDNLRFYRILAIRWIMDFA
jgi:hypothetical protein